MNVSLTPELAKWIEQKVDSGKYGSASEVVRAALRSLMEQDDLHQAKLASLRADVAEGLMAIKEGRTSPWTKEKAEAIKREGRKSLQKQKSA